MFHIGSSIVLSWIVVMPHLIHWPPSWPAQETLQEEAATVCVQPVSLLPEGQDAKSFPHMNQGKAHWMKVMAPPIDLYYEVLARNGVCYPVCELCRPNHAGDFHCWPDCKSRNHWKNVWERIEEITLPWEQARNYFYQQFQVANLMVRFNHLDGSIDAEVISSWRPPPPACPLPWFSRADRLAQQQQPSPPSYPPPQHDRLQQDSTGATGSSEEHIGSSIPEQPPPTRQNDLAPNPRLLGSPLGPHHTALDQHPHLEAGPDRAMGAAAFSVNDTTGIQQTTPPSPGPQFGPWHLDVVLGNDNAGLERAIQHLREEFAAAQVLGVGVRLEMKLVSKGRRTLAPARPSSEFFCRSSRESSIGDVGI